MKPIEVELELRENKDCPLTYSVKINGQEVSEHISGLTYAITPGNLPKLRLELYTHGVNLKSQAILDVPEPYNGIMDFEIKKALK